MATVRNPLWLINTDLLKESFRWGDEETEPIVGLHRVRPISWWPGTLHYVYTAYVRTPYVARDPSGTLIGGVFPAVPSRTFAPPRSPSMKSPVSGSSSSQHLFALLGRFMEIFDYLIAGLRKPDSKVGQPRMHRVGGLQVVVVSFVECQHTQLPLKIPRYRFMEATRPSIEVHWGGC